MNITSTCHLLLGIELTRTTVSKYTKSVMYQTKLMEGRTLVQVRVMSLQTEYLRRKGLALLLLQKC